MVTLYLTSSAGGTGKTSVAAGLARRLLSQNRKVGYLKPVVAALMSPVDTDAAVMQRFLGLSESLDVLAPAFADENALRNGIKAAVNAVSSGRDAVIVEGPSARGQLALDMATALGATVLGVESFAVDSAGLASYYKALGNRLAGVVVNKVPQKRVAQVQSGFAARSGVSSSLGTVPEVRAAAGLSVGELAGDVGGRIVSGAGGSDVIVENIMLAAMNPDHGPEYYALKEKKAVIVRSDRPDMQLAALETPTACLVLAGAQPPIQIVLRRAEANRVAVISTKNDTAAVIAGIEAGLRDIRVNDARAAAVAAEIDRSLDFGALFRNLGLSV